MQLIKAYYTLSKPGIVYGNLLSVIAGFFLASKLHVNFIILVSSLFGVAFIIGSSCAFNNIIDINIDKQMKRTLKRPSVTGEISRKNALIYASIIGLIGFIILIAFTNPLTVVLGLFGVFMYVVIYGIAKRKTVYGTLIGAIPGAIPLVAGYTAVTNRLDLSALILFLIMGAWQMPHFYAIAMYRLKDYTKAGLVLWPVKRGILSTKIQIILYVTLFGASSVALYFMHAKGIIYLILASIISIVWLYKGIKGFNEDEYEKWAKGMFFYSLIALLSICAFIAFPWI